MTKDKNPMLTDGLPKIIRWFKGRSSYETRKIHADFAWQPRYHDRIVRDQAECNRIANYIKDNPMNWEQDEMYI